MTLTRGMKLKSETTEHSTMEDHVSHDANGGLPHRPKQQPAPDGVGLRIHPLPSGDEVLISVQPPKEPQVKESYSHVDIVLVIDVSGSMHWSAPLPDTQDREEKESAGLSVLDLTKHAARTILAPLNEHDRLALVTFSANAKIVQDLTYMTIAAKKEMWSKIEGLVHDAATNLWAGIKTGLKVFEHASINNNVQGMFVLTDGMPNHMCPPQGYVTKLKPMLAEMASSRPQVPTIHTFGFGYDMRSDLMQSIAEVGNGNYAFIPDAGMIGTIFVHAMANLLSTFCAEAELEITTSNSKDLHCATVFNVDRPNPKTMILRLGTVQYGQSRDIVISSNNAGKQPIVVRATLKYKQNFLDEKGAEEETKSITASLDQVSETHSQPFSDYHSFRSQLCAFLAAFFPIQDNGEHLALSYSKDSLDFEHARSQMDSLVMRIRASPCLEDPNVKSLLTDLVGDEPAGQIAKAVSTSGKVNFYQRWGRHYLPSLLHAHARQVCNSFKDPGPLRYGLDSPLFIKFRTEMDATFENLPPPKPSRPPQQRRDGTHIPQTNVGSMARYHSSSNPCFDEQAEVHMGDHSSMAVSELRPGMQVWTPIGARKVAAIVKTNPMSKGQDQICRVGDLWVTPYHPIEVNSEWVFPADIAEESRPCRSSVYSVLLSFSTKSDAHVMRVGGQNCTTLGHGVRQSSQETGVRGHAFFGSYVKVVQSLMKLPRDGNRHLISAGVQRDPKTGLVCGFKAAGMKASVRRSPMRKSGVEMARHPARYNFRVEKAVRANA